MRRRRTSIATSLLVLAFGCSSQSTTPKSGGQSQSSSTVAVVTTTPLATSTVPATVTPTSNSTAATTTTVPVVDHEKLVRTSYEAYMAAYWVCLRSPATCEPGTLTSPDSPAFRTLSRSVHDMRAGGLRIGADPVGYTVIESVAVDVAAGRATVTTCNWDTAVLYGPPAWTGGPEVVMNNKRLTTRFRSVMYLDGVAWKLGEEHGVENIEEVNTCSPAS